MLEDFEQSTFNTSSGVTINFAKGGNGPALLMLHGYPETHVMWHKIAPRLAQDFTVVLPDLRGYGDSSKPDGGSDHINYSKRAMAQDQVEVMAALGFDQFQVVGHDRGARVGHRMALDHAERVTKLAVLDIAPTYTMYMTTDKAFATAYYHWFFLIQPAPFPETLIGADPEYYIRTKMHKWCGDFSQLDAAALDEYIRCFHNPATIHASCEDYRAAAGIDLRHDEADLDTKVSCPVLVLWGAKGFVGKRYDVIETWRERATNVVGGAALPSGHFLAEEAPDETYTALHNFLV